MRTQLDRPGQRRLVGPQAYDQLFTMHGVTMIFLFVIPISTGAFGNYLRAADDRRARHGVPAHERAVASGSSSASGLFMYIGLVDRPGAGRRLVQLRAAGARAVQPRAEHRLLRARADLQRHLDDGGRVNFIVTIFKLRAPGMSLNRMPLFCFAFLAVVVRAGLRAAGADRRAASSSSSTAGSASTSSTSAHGGDPLLWQHLFWIFGHPEVYIIILPAFGIATSIIPTFARRRMVAFPLVALAELLVAFIGFGVWAHHMFATGLRDRRRSSTSPRPAMIIVIPSGDPALRLAA